MNHPAPFWECPPADLLDRPNLIDFISVEQARDRLVRMRPLADGLVFEKDHSGRFGTETHLVFGRGDDSLCDIRYDEPKVSMHLRGRLDGRTHGDHANVSLRFPSSDVGDLRDPTVPLRIVDAWIAQLSQATVTLQGDLTSLPEDSADLHAPLRRPLLDVCTLIHVGNPGRDPGSPVRMHAPSPGIPGAIVDRSGKQLVRRNVENDILQGVPTVLRFNLATPDSFVLDGLEFSVAQKAVAYDPMTIMRMLAERSLAHHRSPLLSAARKP